MKTGILRPCLMLALAVAAQGCGNKDDNGVHVSELERLELSDAKLTKLGASATQTMILNGVAINTIGVSSDPHFFSFNDCNTCDSVAASASAESADGNFSTTTTQESGVDESDRVKYDGSNLYLAANPVYTYWAWGADEGETESDADRPHVRVLQRNPDDSLSHVTNFALPDGTRSLENLYVGNDRLAALYGVFENNASNNDASTGFLGDIWYPYEQNFGIRIADVTDVQEIVTLATYQIDGHVLSSRRIEDKLYVVSTYSPNIKMDTYPETDAERQAFYEALSQDDSLQYLPTIKDGDGTSPLVAASDCYLPEGTSDKYGHASVVTLTTFNLTSPDNYDSVCVLASVDGFYASSKAIYFYGAQYDEPQSDGTNMPNTVIHKFSYDGDSVTYKATGKVRGSVSSQNAHLRFNEKDDYLRLVTTQTDWRRGEIDHTLYVLQPGSDNELELVAHLPNDARPKKIGKPGEDIYAVRYFGDKAYVVTFERIDPLYVLDLSTPLDPKIAGELEVPGYSAYLQPLNDKYVVGIGQQIDPNREANTVVEGAKIELYDVGDMAAPKVVSTLVFENGYTPVEWDYHALTQLQTGDNEFRLALPVYTWQSQQVSADTWLWQQSNSMRLISVDVSAASPGLSQVGSLDVEDDKSSNWGDRAVLHGDIVYYVRHNDIWQSYWSNPGYLVGPF